MPTPRELANQLLNDILAGIRKKQEQNRHTGLKTEATDREALRTLDELGTLHETGKRVRRIRFPQKPPEK